MERRRFLKYTTLATAGFAISSCNRINNFLDDNSFLKPDFGKLEKTNLLIGFVPITNSAPLIIAQEKGFFKRYGLSVNLSKQSHWNGIQSGLLQYRFDAAQALFGMPLLAQLGKNYAPLISLMVLNLNGSAITLSQKAWKAGIRPSLEYVNFPEFTNSFRKYLRRRSQPLPFGIESPTSVNYPSRFAVGFIPVQD